MTSKQTKAAGPSEDLETDIIGILHSCYDRAARRYMGAETDKTVAETIGGGCMPGWVALVRERRFGPAGNEAVEAISLKIAELEALYSGALADLAPLKAQIAACVASHDRRVGAK